ncbi:hypothetical protein [Nocardia sp. NPDC003345]
MVPLTAITEQFPVIGARVGAQETSLASYYTAASQLARPVATGPHLPGALLSAAFGLVERLYFTNLDAGVAEKMRAGQTTVEAGVALELTDTSGGLSVGANGAALAPGKIGG